ncbi:MAG: ROK family protein [Candidatus Cloacimonas sp.]|jgi:predicted NBD/HSP70 family sugar kinase|nr:ROK family protein [Candidatus Cloacimonas sp.]
MNTYLGIDIGGSSFKYGWGNSQDGLKFFGTLPIVKKNLATFKNTAINVLHEAQSRFGLHKISAIGVGTPGTIDWATGKTTGVNPNLPFWVKHSPQELIPAAYGLPVFYDNDANLMALAEAIAGKQQNILGLTVGSGIGGGIVVNGKIFRGKHGFAGELGHVCMVHDGAICNCGKYGCLEAYASVDGLRNRLAKESLLYEKMELSMLLSIRLIDPLVECYLCEGAKLFSRAIANAITLVDPESVIIGGGAMEIDMYSIPELKKEVESCLPKANIGRVELKKAVYGNKAGVMGAIILAEQSLIDVSE